MTRVKHPRNLVFEDDLPDYGVFQAVRESERFRSRKRHSLRLRAAFPRTILRYACGASRGVLKRIGFGDHHEGWEKERWQSEDAALALRLLEELEGATKMRLIEVCFDMRHRVNLEPARWSDVVNRSTYRVRTLDIVVGGALPRARDAGYIIRGALVEKLLRGHGGRRALLS